MEQSLQDQFLSLVKIVAQLRGPGGCPWDKEQTQRSLCQYIIEEAFELVEAIEADPSENKQNTIKEELGDFLFQVILQAQVAKDLGYFDIDDVVASLCEKMVRRHPHVFENPDAGPSKSLEISQIWKKWEEIKKTETPNKKTFSYPRSLPALQASLKIGVKTEGWKFDWELPTDVLPKIHEELSEVIEAIQHVQSAETAKSTFPPVNDPTVEMANLEMEIGDLLFAVAQLSRKFKIDPEQALRRANAKFEHRFEKMIQISKLSKDQFAELSLDKKEQLWGQAKVLTKSSAI